MVPAFGIRPIAVSVPIGEFTVQNVVLTSEGGVLRGDGVDENVQSEYAEDKQAAHHDQGLRNCFPPPYGISLKNEFHQWCYRRRP